MNLSIDDKPFATTEPAVLADGGYRPVSYWQETIEIVPGPPLGEDIACDVAIVGGGFTGLSTAYELKKRSPSLDVVLLERSVVGHGASGRNGGFAMPLIGWDLLSVSKKLGQERAGSVYRLMYDAVDHVKQVVRENKIECDLEETGYLFLATCPVREKHLRTEHELAGRLGFDHTFLQGDDLHAHIRSDAFCSGLFDPHPAIVNPAKLARGLKAIVETSGVRIYEQTPLRELVDGQPVTLRTSFGTVRAKRVVLALNGYGESLGFLRNRVHPVHTYIVLTEPLTDADLDAVGWSGKRASLETARNFIHYFRLTADNRILFGGEDAALYYGGKLRDTHTPTFARLEARFREYFPALDHVKISHRWGGVLGVTLDMFPTFGFTGENGSIFYSTGYSGHGVSLSNYAGCLLAPRVLKTLGITDVGPEPPEPFFFNRTPMSVPPDPFRYVGLQGYRLALRMQDSWQKA